MMPVADTPHHIESVDYKKKYKTLKRKLKFLVYEHECFLEELRKAQRKLLKVTRDRSFLLDRLIQYEKTDDSSSDSDVTLSTDSEAEAPKDGSTGKKKKTEPTMSMFGSSMLLSNLGYNPLLGGQVSGIPSQPGQSGSKSSEPAKKRAKVSKKTSRPTAGNSPGNQNPLTSTPTHSKHPQFHQTQQPGHMTREELERHLELKQSTRPQFMSIDKTPNTLPDNIFSNENSNPDSDFGLDHIKQEGQADDSDLIIDMPQD